MPEALLWGAVGASSLVLGAVLGLGVRLSKRVLALLMGFGAGTLISAVSFELAEEALAQGGALALVIGLAVGALAFYFGDRLVEGMGGQERPQRPRGADAGSSGNALVLGAVLDGVPEQAAIGLSLASGESVGIALVAAVFLSNVPESVASAAAMRRVGHGRRQVLGLWLGVAVLLTAASGLGYLLLGDASGTVTGTVQGVAAGAILVMLADSLIPEALRGGGPTVGLVTTLGFALAVLISQAG